MARAERGPLDETTIVVGQYHRGVIGARQGVRSTREREPDHRDLEGIEHRGALEAETGHAVPQNDTAIGRRAHLTHFGDPAVVRREMTNHRS